VTAIKRGAYDFIEKPFKADRLTHIVNRALDDARLRRQIEDMRDHGMKESDMTGESAAIESVRQNVERLADSNCRILLTGPSGAGKELVARVIHRESARQEGPFVIFNCAKLRSDQQELELFGVEPGKGQSPRKVGIFEKAHGGTLLLDEVADMSPSLQTKILKILQQGTYKRIGGDTPIHLDVRVLASSNQDLEKLMEEGVFRKDLYFRLGVETLEIPPLAERQEDIPAFYRPGG